MLPKLLEVYADDEMSLEQLMSFTISDDHARQEQVWETVQRGYIKEPYYIRKLLTENTVRASDKRARFVGLAVYEEAGGIAGMMAAIEDGMYQPAMKARMDELEGQKADTLARMKEVPADVPDIHPNVAEIYRRRMQHLTAALDDPEMRAEAAEVIRSAVDEVILTPGDKRGDVRVSLRGDLMGILDIAADRKGQNRSQVITKDVASPRNQIR